MSDFEDFFVLADDSPSGLRWKVARGSRVVTGMVAGTLDCKGYWVVQLNGKLHKAHRVIYQMRHGFLSEEVEIDHVDGNPGNNSVGNLRLASRTQNNRNQRRRKDNTSGVKGVSFSRRNGKWKAYIGVDGKQCHLGYFETAEEAAMAVAAARGKEHGEFSKD